MKLSEIQTNNPLILKDDGIYYKRKIDGFLDDWKTKKGHLPLVIKGLRQSGKSKSIIQFGIRNYKTVIYIDFRNHGDYAPIFSDYDIEKIKERLSVAFGFGRYIDGETLFIFDEIQDCPIARGSLKNFAQDGRYDVIASGSMLGLSGYNESMESYIPAGYETIVRFEPMDFEEFLWAYGLTEEYTNKFKTLLSKEEKIDPVVHDGIMKVFRTYLIVGGMPKAVKVYFENHDLIEVRKVQRSLMDSYRDDFGTHLNDKGQSFVRQIEKAKINRVLDSMPAQLTKENGSKFAYNVLSDSHAKGSKYEGTITWLVDYGLLRICKNLTKLDLVQAGYTEEKSFKLYFADTGLFASQLDPSFAKSIYEDNLDKFKGVIYENIVADSFGKAGRPLYYYSLDYESEIDFVTTYQGKVALVEAKAKKGKVRSADKLLAKLNDDDKFMILKLTSQNIGRSGAKLTIPYYLASFLPNQEESFPLVQTDLPDPNDLLKMGF